MAGQPVGPRQHRTAQQAVGRHPQDMAQPVMPPRPHSRQKDVRRRGGLLAIRPPGDAVQLPRFGVSVRLPRVPFYQRRRRRGGHAPSSRCIELIHRLERLAFHDHWWKQRADAFLLGSLTALSASWPCRSLSRAAPASSVPRRSDHAISVVSVSFYNTKMDTFVCPPHIS